MVTGQRILIRIQFFFIITFILVKFYLRPWVIEKDFSGFLETFVFSYPNFCEAVAGSFMVVFFLLIFNHKFLKKASRFSEHLLIYIGVMLSAIYVLLQEYKIHNLGGNNVFDINDVIFSILGLVLALGILLKVDPKVLPSEN